MAWRDSQFKPIASECEWHPQHPHHHEGPIGDGPRCKRAFLLSQIITTRQARRHSSGCRFRWMTVRTKTRYPISRPALRSFSVNWNLADGCWCTAKPVSVRLFSLLSSLDSPLKALTGRSTTFVAAYLMYSRGLDRDDTLGLIRKARPIIQ